MLLKSDKDAYFEASDEFENLEYDIGDIDMAIQVARDKLYTYPIRTLVQEYVSNAYDACIEAGTCPSSIEINHPTHANPIFSVRDKGPGLSPTRVKEVFVRYFASTKRESKKQQGFFGIGAKAAWAYKGCDSFTVVSYHAGVKYTYVAHSGLSSRGTLSLLSKEPSEEPSGVCIMIAVRPDDFEVFKQAIQRAVFLWVKVPKIGLSIPSPVFSGKGYRIFKEKDLPFIQNATKVIAAASGLTPYEMPGAPFVENRVLVVDVPMADMGISPSREAFMHQDIAHQKVDLVKKEASATVRELCLSGKAKVALEMGLHRWSNAVRGLAAIDLFRYEPYVSIYARKEKKVSQELQTEVGVPVCVPSDIKMVYVDTLTDPHDPDASKRLWRKVKRHLSLQAPYRIVVVCKNSTYREAESVDLNRICSHISYSVIDPKAPVKVKSRVGVPVRIMEKGTIQPWVMGASARLQDFDINKTALFTGRTSVYTTYLTRLGYTVVCPVNDNRMAEALEVGYKKDKDLALDIVLSLDEKELFACSIYNLSNKDWIKRLLHKLAGIGLPGIHGEVALDEAAVLNPIDKQDWKYSALSGVLHSLNIVMVPTVGRLAKDLFPLANSYGNSKDVDIYVKAKHDYLMQNPTEEFNALLSISEKLYRLKYERPDDYPYFFGPKIQEGDKSS